MRVNLEDRWYKDTRRDDLIAELSGVLLDKRLIGALVDGVNLRAMQLAQQFWLKGQRPIPLEAWEAQRIPEAYLKVGLAWRVNESGDPIKTDQQPNTCSAVFVYVDGTQEAYADYFERQKKKREAGQASAAARAARDGTAIPSNARNRPDGNPTDSGQVADQSPNTRSVGDGAAPNGTEPSSSSSPSSSVSDSAGSRSSVPRSATPPSAGSAPAPVPLTRPAIDRCKTEWIKTLEHFQQGRGLTLHEEERIARAIQTWGAENVELALIGARHEKGDERFDPAANVNLQRVLPYDDKPADRDRKFGRFLGLGAGARGKGQSRTEGSSFEQELEEYERQQGLAGG